MVELKSMARLSGQLTVSFPLKLAAFAWTAKKATAAFLKVLNIKHSLFGLI
jgi:hypothetical protein